MGNRGGSSPLGRKLNKSRGAAGLLDGSRLDDGRLNKSGGVGGSAAEQSA
ncbi:MAG: hypothetical protein FWF94_06330 [Oscillospiraceae bacterium]|nr:hypothetical protein [Oscillospiraceae bacterium]